MAKNKPKFYVVWEGRETGIFDSWNVCKKLVEGYEGAKYKSFENKVEATAAFKQTHYQHIGKNSPKTVSQAKLAFVGKPIADSVSVDAAWNTATGYMEYQGVYTPTKELLFRKGPYAEGTNNIGEFLAIVHALAWLKKNNDSRPIYSDSRTAMAWVRNKKAKTTLVETSKNAELFELLNRAEHWLATNTYTNKILKWETEYWGENPADFGRK